MAPVRQLRACDALTVASAGDRGSPCPLCGGSDGPPNLVWAVVDAHTGFAVCWRCNDSVSAPLQALATALNIEHERINA